MSFTTDPNTNVGLVRLRIFDRDNTNQIFDDETIEAVFNNLERTSVKRTAAFLLETIATQQALILKVMKNLELTTDGAKLADSLAKQAASLRSQADIDDAAIDDAFDWAEQVFDVFGERERLLNEILRNA
jgi:hypothetical protein